MTLTVTPWRAVSVMHTSSQPRRAPPSPPRSVTQYQGSTVTPWRAVSVMHTPSTTAGPRQATCARLSRTRSVTLSPSQTATLYPGQSAIQYTPLSVTLSLKKSVHKYQTISVVDILENREGLVNLLHFIYLLIYSKIKLPYIKKKK